MQQASLTRQSQTISGVLSVYWHEQQVKLAINTDTTSQQQLFRNTPKPKLIDHTRSDMKFVDLHWRGDKAQLQQALNQAFGKHLPTSFWQNRYGIVNLPARERTKFQLAMQLRPIFVSAICSASIGHTARLCRFMPTTCLWHRTPRYA